MDVVPNRMEMATTPGNRVNMAAGPLPDLMKNIPVHASGKINPQLMFGGFR